MMKTIDADLLDSLKPSIREKIRLSLTEAFEMAVLISDKSILEETIDKLSDQYADKLSEPDNEDVRQTVVIPPIDPPLKHKTGHGVNLVNGRSLPPAPTPYKTQSKSGYRGIEKRRNRWRARYSEKHLPGSYRTPEEAARAYDRTVFQKTGSTEKMNFPEEYKKIR